MLLYFKMTWTIRSSSTALLITTKWIPSLRDSVFSYLRGGLSSGWNLAEANFIGQPIKQFTTQQHIYWSMPTVFSMREHDELLVETSNSWVVQLVEAPIIHSAFKNRKKLKNSAGPIFLLWRLNQKIMKMTFAIHISPRKNVFSFSSLYVLITSLERKLYQ